MEGDPDFDLIKADQGYGSEFNTLVNSINEKRDRYKAQKSDG